MKYQVCRDLTPIEFESLRNDIADNGVLIPVEVDESGEILDGHHRVKAWNELVSEGVSMQEYPRIIRAGLTEEQKRNHARKLNALRRHMDKDEREQMMVDMRKDGMSYRQIAQATGVSKNTAQRTIETSGVPFGTPEVVTGADGKQYPAEQEPKPSPPQSALLIATNEKQQNGYLSTLRQAKTEAPDVYDNIVRGKMKVTAANRELRNREKQSVPFAPTSKYRVWYADPPWEYGNSGVINDSDGYGRAERHYPTMSIEELCLMGHDIDDACADNAVLFMWVTSPLLEDSFKVINAWGFKYKTSFVWDKVGHNYGHYNSVRHEFLLICTRGSCTPDEKTLYDSVVEFDKTRKHSEKPEIFRDMIDTLYTHGNRIELFARKAAPGWDAWGNEEVLN